MGLPIYGHLKKAAEQGRLKKYINEWVKNRNAGFNINTVDDENAMELFELAAAKGNIEIIKLLTENEETRMCLNVYQPLAYACLNGHMEVVKYLVESDKTENHSNVTGQGEPIKLAALAGYHQIVDYLLESLYVNCPEKLNEVLFEASSKITRKEILEKHGLIKTRLNLASICHDNGVNGQGIALKRNLKPSRLI